MTSTTVWLLNFVFSCPVYNNLPSNQCYLVKADGQCCAQPMCYDPSTQTVVNPMTSPSVFPVVGTYAGGFTGFRPYTTPSGTTTSGTQRMLSFVCTRLAARLSYRNCLLFFTFIETFQFVFGKAVRTVAQPVCERQTCRFVCERWSFWKNWRLSTVEEKLLHYAHFLAFVQEFSALIRQTVN